MSGYFAVTMSATCCQAAFSASLPDHMNHFKVTGAAAAAVDRPARPRPSADNASADARAKRAKPSLEPFLIASPPIFDRHRDRAGQVQVHSPLLTKRFDICTTLTVFVQCGDT